MSGRSLALQHRLVAGGRHGLVDGLDALFDSFLGAAVVLDKVKGPAAAHP